MPVYNGKEFPELIPFPFLEDADTPGVTNAVGDYSAAQKFFQVGPPAGEVWAITRMIVGLEGVGKFLSQNYADLAAPLTNGICLETADGSGAPVLAIVPLEDTIKTNADWSYRCHDAIPSPMSQPTGNSNSFMSVRWTFDESGGPIVLRGDRGEVARAIFNDNFTGIVTHSYHIHGFKIEG